MALNPPEPSRTFAPIPEECWLKPQLPPLFFLHKMTVLLFLSTYNSAGHPISPEVL